MDEFDKPAGNCCLGSKTPIKGVDTTTTDSYFGFEGELDNALSFCMPPDKSTHMVAKYKDTNNDDIYIVCVGGTPGAADTTNAAYPSGKTKTCSEGRYVLVNGTSYNTPDYTTTPDGKPITDPSAIGPYPTQFYRPSNYSEDTNNICTMGTDGTWPEACRNGGVEPAAWLIQYIEE